MKAHLLAARIARRKVIRASNQGINHTEVHAHIPHCLAAHWACVVVSCVLRKTVTVHEMSTRQLLQQAKMCQQRGCQRRHMCSCLLCCVLLPYKGSRHLRLTAKFIVQA